MTTNKPATNTDRKGTRKPTTTAPEIAAIAAPDGKQRQISQPQAPQAPQHAHQAPEADPMELARQRRAERLAEARAAKDAAEKVMDNLIKSVKAEPINKKPEWNIDLMLACSEAPEAIKLQDSLKGSYLDKASNVRYFYRTPNIDRLDLSVEQNLEGVRVGGEKKRERNDPMLKIVRAFIADNLAALKGDGTEIVGLIDNFTVCEPVRQATLTWSHQLVGPQSILNQVALQSGRYALLNPVTGKVKLVRDFYAKK